MEAGDFCGPLCKSNETYHFDHVRIDALKAKRSEKSNLTSFSNKSYVGGEEISNYRCMLKNLEKFMTRPPHLTHFRPAMPFGNRKIYFRGSFQFSIVTIKK